MSRNPSSIRSTCRPQLEALEDRFAPSSMRGGLERLWSDPSDVRSRDHLQAPDRNADDQQKISTTSDVLSFADLSVKGSSTLTRSDDSVSIKLKTTDLTPGAYTMWWVVFNNPEACVNGPGHCGEDPADFAVDGPAGFGFTWADGGIVGPNGEHTFTSRLREGRS